MPERMCVDLTTRPSNNRSGLRRGQPCGSARQATRARRRRLHLPRSGRWKATTDCRVVLNCLPVFHGTLTACETIPHHRNCRTREVNRFWGTHEITSTNSRRGACIRVAPDPARSGAGIRQRSRRPTAPVGRRLAPGSRQSRTDWCTLWRHGTVRWP